MKGYPWVALVVASFAISMAHHGHAAGFADSSHVPAQCRRGALPSLAAASQAVACAVADRRLLIVSDLHGTREIPDLVAEVARDVSADRPVRLGLEIESFEQARIQTYMTSKGMAEDKAALLHDGWWSVGEGRMSGAIAGLIESARKLRAAGRDVQVFTTAPAYPGEAAIKAAGGGEAFKENYMADAIRQVLDHGTSDQLVIALMGNHHAGYKPGVAGVAGVEATVTERLAAQSPYVLQPYSFRGEVWNCQAAGCGPHPVPAEQGPLPSDGQGLSWTLSAPAARAGGVVWATLRLPVMTASAPAKKPIAPPAKGALSQTG